MAIRKKRTPRIKAAKARPGSSIEDANAIAGNADFGVPESDVAERAYTSKNTKRADPGAAPVRSSENDSRTSGAGGYDSGAGSSSGGVGARIERRGRRSLHRTAALSLAALILYLPANVLPILHLELYGAVSENTVWDGVVKFYQERNYVIALIVLLASIVIPLCKLFGLFFVVITTSHRSSRLKMLRTWLFRFIDSIGRWAMLDVFVVAIWVAVVKIGQLADVSAGQGLLPFGCVVVLTLLASASFDPQLIWEPQESLQ